MAADKLIKSLKMKMFFLMLFRSLKIRKSRVSIAFFSITLGTAIIAALLSVYLDISIKMSRELRTYGANFFVGPEVSSEDRAISQDVFEDIVKKVPSGSLAGASPFIYGIVRLDLDNAVMAGVDFSGLKKLSPYWQVEGEWISVDFDEKNCMIGKSLAKNMELGIGDTVNIVSLETGFQKALIVKGIMETGEAEDQQIFVNLSLARKLLAMEGKINHAMFSFINEGMDINAFAENLEKEYQGIHAMPMRKVSHSEGMILDKIKGLMAFIAVIILAITTLCVMTTLMAMVVERTREIGLMKALGADNSGIVIHFLAETAAVALLGGIAGLAGGFLLAQILGQAIFSSSISFRLIVLPLTLTISLAAALTASILPLKRAVSIVPAKVLKEE